MSKCGTMPLNVCHNVSSYVTLGTKYVSESRICNSYSPYRVSLFLVMLGVLNMSVCLIQSLNVL